MTVHNDYNCGQGDLYLACRDAITLFADHIADFSDASPRYDAQFLADLKQQLADTKNMPDFQTRNSVPETIYTNLKAAADELLRLFRFLRLYIEQAYPPSLVKPHLEAAGNKFFADAINNSWDDCDSICTNASNFITNNLAQLLADNNMAPNFPNKFSSAVTTFTNLHAQYVAATKDSEDGTSAKITANNRLYKNVLAVLNFGRTLYSHNPALAEKFTFAYQLSYISGTKAAGLQGLISDSTNNTPIYNAKISASKTGTSAYTATANSEGIYELSPMASGTYTITCEADGYTTFTTTKEVLIGTISKLPISLTPIASAPIPPAL